MCFKHWEYISDPNTKPMLSWSFQSAAQNKEIQHLIWACQIVIRAMNGGKAGEKTQMERRTLFYIRWLGK